MRIVIQRVAHASVTIEGKIKSKIGQGLLILVGIEDADYGYSTAINFFNSVVNFLVLFVANAISRKLSETSLW